MVKNSLWIPADDGYSRRWYTTPHDTIPSPQIPTFFLDNIIEASQAQLSNVRNASSLKVYAVDYLKAMTMVEGCSDVDILQAILDVHHSWQEFRHQSHDLFIVVFLSFHVLFCCILFLIIYQLII